MFSISIPTITISATTIASVVTFVYQRRKYAKSLTRQLGLESFTTYLRRGVSYRLARYLRPRASAALSLREFALNRLAASSDRLTVPAAVPVELRLDEMFVPLTALSAEQQRVSAAQIAHGEYRRILLVGDPGSGKSTLVKRIYRDICRHATSLSLNGRIPVLIELKNLDSNLASRVAGPNPSLEGIVRRDVTSVQTYAGDELYESFLNAGRVVVMLDGLDEVKTSDFDTVSREIVQLCDTLARYNADNRVIVTTRRQLYVNLPESFTDAFEIHLTLEPFTTEDMYNFLQKWPYKQQPEREFARIFARLASQPNIRSMCQTPLILAMYVATDQLTGGEGLPETRPDFYRSVTDELLVRRRGRQFGLTTGLSLLLRNRQQLLGRLAIEHLLDGKQSRNTLQWDTAINLVREHEGLSSDAAAAVLLRELSRDTGLFTEERREETLRFIHLTFCEFLAATAVAKGADEAWEKIVKGVESDPGGLSATRFVERLAEVIVFAVALEENAKTRRKRARWAVEACGPDIALRTMLDCQPYDDSAVVNELERLAGSIVSAPAPTRDDNWLYLFRQAAMVLRDRELVANVITGENREFLAPFFERTVDGSPSDFDRLFLSYVRLDPAGALQLSQSLDADGVTNHQKLLAKALDEPAVLAHVLARFTRDERGVREWAWILALGALYFQSVFDRLMSMKAEDGVNRALDNGDHDDWRRNWMTKGTILGTIMQASREWPGPSTTLAIFANAPVRRTRVGEALGNVTIGAHLSMISTAVTGIILGITSLSGMWLGLFIVGLFLMWLLEIVRRVRRGSVTARLLSPSSRIRWAPHVGEDIPAVLTEFIAEPTISFRRIGRLARKGSRQKMVRGRRKTWRYYVVLLTPSFLLWYPNWRIAAASSAAMWHLPTELPEAAAVSEA
ncbi:NACHT domain-containing protein [Kribbella sp. NPDC026611]|uniref:NACHT domain-containing protein n=1 Tax=Kribbella sp. NPDC026611 TaxID=3154911 RepID=UPI0033DBFC28